MGALVNFRHRGKMERTPGTHLKTANGEGPRPFPYIPGIHDGRSNPKPQTCGGAHSLIKPPKKKKIEKKLITWLPEVKEADDASRSKYPSIISFKCHQRDIFVTSPNFPQGGIRYLRVGTRKRVQCLRKIFAGVCVQALWPKGCWAAVGIYGHVRSVWWSLSCTLAWISKRCKSWLQVPVWGHFGSF